MLKKTFGLAACGVMAALAAVGCGSGSSGSPATAGKGAGPAPATATASAEATTSPEATTPAWAKSLGPGVTVTDSRTAKAGDDSPAGVFLSMLKAIRAGNSSRVCALYEPSLQSACNSGTPHMSAAEFKSTMPTVKDLVLSYTAFDGNKALLGATGTMCDASSCFTNTNPAAGFDSGKSFSTLWQVPIVDSNPNGIGYALARYIKVNGTWYVYAASM